MTAHGRQHTAVSAFGLFIVVVVGRVESVPLGGGDGDEAKRNGRRCVTDGLKPTDTATGAVDPLSEAASDLPRCVCAGTLLLP